MTLKLPTNSVDLFLIEDSQVGSLEINYLGSDFEQDSEKFYVRVSDAGLVPFKNTVLISNDVYEARLDHLHNRLPKRQLDPQESFMIAGRAFHRYLGLNIPHNEPYRVFTGLISTFFDFGSSVEIIDGKLQKIVLTFFKLKPNEVITVEDLFISTNYDTDTILSRIAYLKKRGILRPFFTKNLSSTEMAKILESEQGKRISMLKEWGEEAGYVLTEDGFEKLERLINITVTTKNRYFQLVDIPQIKGKFAFVLQPLNPEKFDLSIYNEVIKPFFENELKIRCFHADEVSDPGVINNQVYTCIERAEIVIAELSVLNRNVDIELGMSLRADKPVFILTQDEIDNIGFDVRDKRIIQYKDKEDLRQKLREKIKLH